MRRYSHIFICAATILAMVECAKSDLDGMSETDQLIRFNTSVEATKATETDDDALNTKGNQFNIAAFKSSSKSHYYSDLVTYDGSTWASEESRYWPTYDNLNFFAYSPIEDFIVINDATVYNDYSLTYTCPSAINDQIDLLVKTLSDQSADNGAVDLKFLHALSSIKFKVEFEDESNITLQTISINYVNIEKERTYDFSTGAWGESLDEYFDTDDGLTTYVSVEDTATSSDGNPIVFDEIDNQLMIIPQPVSSSVSDPHYISVKISYTLNSGAQDETATYVETGVMPLPAPNSTSEYKMSEVYTYTIIVNGEQISFGDLSIEEQEEPVAAYGNINLDLITDPINFSEYEEAISTYTTKADETTEEEEHYYYSTAVRVAQLLADDVRDFVVVGSFGSTTGSDGKLGYYGSISSPFFIAANSLEMMPDYEIVVEDGVENMVFETPSSEYLFSIDLRGVFDFPEFGDTHTIDNSTLDGTAPILTSGIFKDLPLLDEVIFPQGLLAIGDYAFQNCMSLSSVDLAKVIHIEEGAFVDCIGLKKVLNGELTRIHDYGFDDCVSLTTIDLSKVTQVDQFGFVDCKSLTNVNLSSLKTIGIHAFERCNELTLQTDTAIPEFESVADYAFSECWKLGENGSHIDLTKATSVGEHAFNECYHIKLARASDDDTYIKMDLLTTVGDYAFTDCALIGSEYEVSMAKIESVGISAFGGCTALNIIDGLQNLTTISVSAFQDCSSLTGYSKSANDKILSLPLVESVENLGFSGSGITNVEFSTNLTSIGSHAFDGCSSLTTISGLSEVTSMGYGAFSNCHELTILELPKLTSEVDAWSFSGYSELKTADFQSAESVGDGAFQNCTVLEDLDLSSAKSVGVMAFQGCSALEELILPEVTSFGAYFIDGCSSLKKLHMDELVTQISEEYVDSDGNPTTENIFTVVTENCPALETLILTNVTSDEFGGWGYFYNYDEDSNASPKLPYLKIIDLSSISKLGAGTFYGLTSIEAIDLRGVTSVGASALQGCTSLVRLNLSGLTDTTGMVDYAFPDDCSKCEIWLSTTQAATVTDGTTWMNRTWKEIHTDNSTFTLISE